MLAPYFFIKQGYRFPRRISVPYFFASGAAGNAGAAIKLFEGRVSPLRFEALRGAVDGFYKGLLNLVHLQCP